MENASAFSIDVQLMWLAVFAQVRRVGIIPEMLPDTGAFSGAYPGG